MFKAITRFELSVAHCCFTLELSCARGRLGSTHATLIRNDGEFVSRVWPRDAFDVRQNALSTRVGHTLHDRLCRGAVPANGVFLPRAEHFKTICQTLRHTTANGRSFAT